MLFSVLIASVLFRISLDFLACSYVIIYFGAVLMLFLFIVMLLDIDRDGYWPERKVSYNFWFLVLVVLRCILFCHDFFCRVHDYGYEDEMFEDTVPVASFGIGFDLHDVMLSFFNYYGIWLVLVGGLLFVVMVGMVNVLTDTQTTVTKLFEYQSRI